MTPLQLNSPFGGTLDIILLNDTHLRLQGPYAEVWRAGVDINDLRGFFPNLSPPGYPQNGTVEIAVKILRHDPFNGAHWFDLVMAYQQHFLAFAPLNGHPHVPNIWGIFHTNSGLPVLLSPFYRKGSVLEYNNRVPGADKNRQIRQIASTLAHFHSQGIIHGSLTSTNVMVANGTNADICLTDTSINTLTTAHLYITPGLNVPSGTGLFIKSSEELLQNIVNVSSDVYQFAGLVYEILTGRRPFHWLSSAQAVLRILTRGHHTLRRPSVIDSRLWAIMLRCWQQDPNMRPTMSEVHQALLSLGL